jgi:hypothetical protein
VLHRTIYRHWVPGYAILLGLVQRRSRALSLGDFVSSIWTKSAFKKSMAVLGSSVVLVVGFDYVTYAATGSSLLLGLHNTEGTPTYITNTGAGSPLALIARSTIYAPFATNAKGMVTNLNS